MDLEKTEKKLIEELEQSFKELGWEQNFSIFLNNLKEAEEAILPTLGVEYSLRLGKLIGYRLAQKENEAIQSKRSRTIKNEREAPYIALERTEKDFRKELIEKLANLEHEQWLHWSKDLAEQLMPGDPSHNKHKIGARFIAKIASWREKYWKPYEDLAEEAKDMDREWAKKVLKIVEEFE